MMKKIYRILALMLNVIVVSVVFSVQAHANSAPSPDITIVLRNNSDSRCFVTVLADNVVEYVADIDAVYSYSESVDNAVIDAFSSYTDADGFAFGGWYVKLGAGENSELSIYRYLEKFRVLAYFPDTDSFSVSDIQTKYAVKSRYSADISAGNEKLNIKLDYDFVGAGLSLVVRMITTVAVELWVASWFMYRDKEHIKPILIVNIITQLLLNVGLNLFDLFEFGGNAPRAWGYLVIIILYTFLELVVFGVESVVYYFSFGRSDKKVYGKDMSVLYAFVANLLSFIVGMILAVWLPGIF